MDQNLDYKHISLHNMNQIVATTLFPNVLLHEIEHNQGQILTNDCAESTGDS